MMKSKTAFKIIFIITTAAIIAYCNLCIKSSEWTPPDGLYRFSMKFAVISFCPLFYYIISSRINVGAKIGFTPFFCDFAVFNTIALFSAFVFQEKLFHHPYFSADTMSELYMYTVALTAFFISRTKTSKPSNRETILSLALICVTLCAWIILCPRSGDIISSLSLPADKLDSEGEFMNWFSHRKLMMELSLTGKLSLVNPHYIQDVIKFCPLAWFRSRGEAHYAITLLALIAFETAIVVIYAKKCKQPFLTFLASAYILRTVMGLISNILLIFSSWVTVPFTVTYYDIIIMVLVILFDTKNKCPL